MQGVVWNFSKITPNNINSQTIINLSNQNLCSFNNNKFNQIQNWSETSNRNPQLKLRIKHPMIEICINKCR